VGNLKLQCLESSTHVIDDSCCSLFCLLFSFCAAIGCHSWSLVVAVEALFLQSRFFLKKKSVILITLVISLDFLLLSFCSFGEHHFDGVTFECSPKALIDFWRRIFCEMLEAASRQAHY
jgi:hypothetical protein